MSALHLLETGTVEILGMLPFSSNYVFLTELSSDSDKVHAVYKPARGERPLWDFPHGSLAAREAAAFVISDAAGFNLVPPTVLRADLPHGPGSLQLFIDHDPQRHYFVLIHEREHEMPEFAALDIVINNADRKGGHVIEGADGRLWGVDHGLSFNIEPKLRTVIWAFAGEPLSADLRAKLEKLATDFTEGDLRARLGSLLDPDEVAETEARLKLLLSQGTFPEPQGPFHMPWPLV